jgi:hypothetical protein
MEFDQRVPIPAMQIRHARADGIVVSARQIERPVPTVPKFKGGGRSQLENARSLKDRAAIALHAL